MTQATGTGVQRPLHPLTADDRGSLIIIIGYSWIVVTAIFTSIRFGLAWFQKLRFKVDDGTFVVGVTFAIAGSVCFLVAANHGLGKRIDNVSQYDLDICYKAIYAGELLSIAAMASAKTSIVLLSDRVAPQSKLAFNIVLGVVFFWSVFSLSALAFQCGLPDPWVYLPDACPTKGYLYYPVIVLNIVTDALLATWIFPTVSKLLMDNNRRATVMVLFGSRVVVCCVAGVQLSSVAKHIRDPDATYESYGRVLWGLSVMHLSVILSTLPRTNHFIAALQNMHATTIITDYELAQPPAGQTAKEVSNGTDMEEPTVPDKASTHSGEARSRSPSLPRSHRSQQPLFEPPLNLTPSAEQGFTTQIVSDCQTGPCSDPKTKRNSHKYGGSDWKKYMRRNKNQSEDMNVSSMFSWKSRNSLNQEQIVQTTEVTQEVEVVQPRESRWVVSTTRRVSRG